ncbi:hypothetical protein [Micromonospora sp. MP36]|uniref:hypothetical protein n=1 Tax=Micromonospora sp. MP36 TaxID=2604468 RepID=UPI0011D80D74|nr:hypothetical protein [Micromonospora sp. MP36]TYC23614.1 hypothetical protein FXF52_14695 [Micromonospora sp. MP36]
MPRREQGWLAVAVTGWIAVNVAVLLLAPSHAPFDWPAQHDPPSGPGQVIAAQLTLVELLLLGLVAYALTRRRPDPAIAERVPPRPTAHRETWLLVAYGILAQLGGLLLGRALDWHPIGFHLAGTLVGTTDPVRPAEAIGWAGYNSLVYTLLPSLWFRRRYTAHQLCLRSADRRGDTMLIVVVLVLESLAQWATLGHAFAGLTAGQIALGAPLTLLRYLAGTVLPTVIFVQGLLVPRYARLTGSTTGTLVLGGLTYAALHVFEGWGRWGSPREFVLTVLFVLLIYALPGAFKTWLTARTGNAWVHAWAYHAVAPHTMHDTGLVVRIFRL